MKGIENSDPDTTLAREHMVLFYMKFQPYLHSRVELAQHILEASGILVVTSPI